MMVQDDQMINQPDFISHKFQLFKILQTERQVYTNKCDKISCFD